MEDGFEDEVSSVRQEDRPQQQAPNTAAKGAGHDTSPTAQSTGWGTTGVPGWGWSQEREPRRRGWGSERKRAAEESEEDAEEEAEALRGSPGWGCDKEENWPYPPLAVADGTKVLSAMKVPPMHQWVNARGEVHKDIETVQLWGLTYNVSREGKIRKTGSDWGDNFRTKVMGSSRRVDTQGLQWDISQMQEDREPALTQWWVETDVAMQTRMGVSQDGRAWAADRRRLVTPVEWTKAHWWREDAKPLRLMHEMVVTVKSREIFRRPSDGKRMWRYRYDNYSLEGGSSYTVYEYQFWEPKRNAEGDAYEVAYIKRNGK